MKSLGDPQTFVVALFCLVLSAFPLACRGEEADPGSQEAPELIVSPETTFFTQPLNEDGTVNYVAALNRLAAEGVSPEQNAFIAMVQAVGPGVIEEETREQTWKLLGVEPIPGDDIHLLDITAYAQSVHPDDQTAAEELQEQLEQEEESLPETGALSAEDYPQLAAWIEANRKPLDALVEANRLRQYYQPLVSTSRLPAMMDNIPTRFESLCGRIGPDLLLLRGRLALSNDDLDAAINDLIALKNLARVFQQHRFMIASLMAISIDANANRLANFILESELLTAEDAGELRKKLTEMGDLPENIEAYCLGARTTALDATQSIYRKRLNGSSHSSNSEEMFGLPDGIVLDCNVLMRLENDFFNRIVGIWGGTPWYLAAPRWDEYTATIKHPENLKDSEGLNVLKASLQKAATPEEASRTFHQIVQYLLEPSFRATFALHTNARVRHRMAIIGLTLAEYKAERGEYPSTLAPLVPKYFTQLPLDLFDGRAIRYERVDEGYRLWSVGKDGEDDGGKRHKKVSRDGMSMEVHADIVWEVGLAKPDQDEEEEKSVMPGFPGTGPTGPGRPPRPGEATPRRPGR